jgi:hypothetical protein
MSGDDGRYSRDRLGLPVPPSTPETASARLWRQEIARREGELVLRELFHNLKINLGEAEARRLFDHCSKPQRRRQSRGVSDPVRDAKLLDMYDLAAEATDNRASMPRRTAERLYGSGPGKFGSSVDAIEKHLRRLLKAREKERKKEAEAATENERLFRVAVEQYEAITKANRLLHDPPAKSGDK